MADYKKQPYSLSSALFLLSRQPPSILLADSFDIYLQISKYFYCYFFFFFRATLAAYGSSQARGQNGAAAAGLQHSHNNSGSKLHVQSTPQLTATSDH